MKTKVVKYDQMKQQAWDACINPLWMVWWIRRHTDSTSFPDIIRLAKAFARHALPVWKCIYPWDKEPEKILSLSRTRLVWWNDYKVALAWLESYANWGLCNKDRSTARWQCNKIRHIFPTLPSVYPHPILGISTPKRSKEAKEVLKKVLPPTSGNTKQ